MLIRRPYVNPTTRGFLEAFVELLDKTFLRTYGRNTKGFFTAALRSLQEMCQFFSANRWYDVSTCHYDRGITSEDIKAFYLFLHRVHVDVTSRYDGKLRDLKQVMSSSMLNREYAHMFT